MSDVNLDPLQVVAHICRQTEYSANYFFIHRTMYLAQKMYAQNHEGCLIKTVFVAGDYGPLCNSVLQKFGDSFLKKPWRFMVDNHHREIEDENIKELLTFVIDECQKMSSTELSASVHDDIWAQHYIPGNMMAIAQDVFYANAVRSREFQNVLQQSLDSEKPDIKEAARALDTLVRTHRGLLQEHFVLAQVLADYSR